MHRELRKKNIVIIKFLLKVIFLNFSMVISTLANLQRFDLFLVVFLCSSVCRCFFCAFDFLSSYIYFSCYLSYFLILVYCSVWLLFFYFFASSACSILVVSILNSILLYVYFLSSHFQQHFFFFLLIYTVSILYNYFFKLFIYLLV